MQTYQRFVNTTPKPSATKNNSDELLLLPSLVPCAAAVGEEIGEVVLAATGFGPPMPDDIIADLLLNRRGRRRNRRLSSGSKSVRDRAVPPHKYGGRRS